MRASALSASPKLPHRAFERLASRPLALQHARVFAGGIDFSASHNVNFLAEIYGKKSYSGSLDRLEPRFGYRMRMGENLYTTLGAGLDIKNRNPEFRLLLTLSYFITPSKKKIRSIEEVD